MYKYIVSLGVLCASTLLAQPRVTGVANGAEFTNILAPGSLSTVFGTGFAAAEAGATSTPLPTTRGSVTVNVNGRAVPLTYAGPGQINFQLPMTTPAGSATLTVVSGGQTSPPATFTVAATAPGIFQYGANRGVVQNQDYSLNSSANLAATGSSIVVYLTGIGVTTPAAPDGSVSPASPLALPTATYSATLGGINARILFLGLTPGNVGLAQANIEVPPLISDGDYPLTIEVGGKRNKSALVSVKGNPAAGLPEGATCVSGSVEYITLSLEKEVSGQADEIVIGDTKLCPACDRKAPVYGPFVSLIDKARRYGLSVDACSDGFGTVDFLRLRR